MTPIDIKYLPEIWRVNASNPWAYLMSIGVIWSSLCGPPPFSSKISKQIGDGPHLSIKWHQLTSNTYQKFGALMHQTLAHIWCQLVSFDRVCAGPSIFKRNFKAISRGPAPFDQMTPIDIKYAPRFDVSMLWFLVSFWCVSVIWSNCAGSLMLIQISCQI